MLMTESRLRKWLGFRQYYSDRVSIEDGADFKGRMEIDRPKPKTYADSESVGVPVALNNLKLSRLGRVSCGYKKSCGSNL